MGNSYWYHTTCTLFFCFSVNLSRVIASDTTLSVPYFLSFDAFIGSNFLLTHNRYLIPSIIPFLSYFWTFNEIVRVIVSNTKLSVPYFLLFFVLLKGSSLWYHTIRTLFFVFWCCYRAQFLIPYHLYLICYIFMKF